MATATEPKIKAQETPRGLTEAERKTLENLATSLSDGTLAFQLQRLADVGHAAIVVEVSRI